MKLRLFILAFIALPGFMAPAFGHDVRAGDVTIRHAWARASIGQVRNGAVYMTLTNDGHTMDRLVKVASPVAKKAALHSHIMQGDVMMMRPVKAIEVSHGAPTVLEPGGLHVMLMGLAAPLKEGDTFPLTLSFEQAGSVEVQVKIRKASAMAPGHGHSKDHAQHAHGTAAAGPSSCHVAVHVTEAAERKPGGARHAGPATQQHSHGGKAMPDMEGAHMVHEPQHDGAFFMAPNKINHLEGVYSEDCGFQLFLYNAFTEPIHVDRFQALIKVLPDDNDEPEVMRFLAPSEDSTVLKAAVGNEVSRPFNIELYVKFPEADEPQLFNIRVAEK